MLEGPLKMKEMQHFFVISVRSLYEGAKKGVR